MFGYDAFRPGQAEIIEAIGQGQHVLAVMPTGAGKSLCYQLPAVAANTRTVVVSPLVALMDDQVAALGANGIAAGKIHSGQSREQNIENWQKFADAEAKLLYLAPERLMQPRMLDALRRKNIGMFVIDEAHCVSKWGADFRPDYEALSQLKERFPNSTIAAFTATADKATRGDIVQKLTAGNCAVFVKGFDRPNIALAVAPKQNLKNSLLAFLRDKKHVSGIVYCLSRTETDKLADWLDFQGFKAIPYHAGKSPEYRREAQHRFMHEEATIMVATVAFGMGIDKADIRFVVHASLPASMEAFYQEIGRAGRDGAAAETLLLYSLQDMLRRQRMIFEGEGDDHFKMLENKRLQALIGYCETAGCRRLALLSYFDEIIDRCGNCDNCLHPPAVEDYSEVARQIIACMRATGQFFGAAHIVDVLRGVQNVKVKERKHYELKSFGAAQKIPKDLLQSLIRQLIAQGAIRVNLERYGALQITDKGQAIFSGNEPFMARIDTKPKRIAGAQFRSGHRQIAEDLPADTNPALLQALKDLRLKIARERAVPAFVVFSDKTLIHMAHVAPQTEDEFLHINGVGQKKLDEFFVPFVEVIRTHKRQEL